MRKVVTHNVYKEMIWRVVDNGEKKGDVKTEI